jgi:hypothetical protein
LIPGVRDVAVAVAGAAEVGEKVEEEVVVEEEEEVEVEEEEVYADSAAVAAGVAAAAVAFPCLHRLAHLWSDGPPLAFGTLAAPRAPGGRNQARTPVLQRPPLPP